MIIKAGKNYAENRNNDLIRINNNLFFPNSDIQKEGKIIFNYKIF